MGVCLEAVPTTKKMKKLTSFMRASIREWTSEGRLEEKRG